VRDRWREVVVDAEARVLVVEDDGAIVGVAAVRPGWLDGFYVAPARWGEGVAAALHDAALEAVRGLGSAEGQGSSKQEAETAAATALLAQVQ